MVLLLAALCFAIFGMTGSCLAESENESSEENLVYDSGIWAGLLFNTQPLGVYAETVRFTPPSSPWTLTKVQIAGWNGYDNKTLPTEKLIYLEIRDEDLNLLYQFTDSQIPLLHISDCHIGPDPGATYNCRWRLLRLLL